MAEITVPEGERPSYAKYVAYTIIGISLVNYVIALPARDVNSPILALGAVLVAGVLNVAIVFLMVQSLIEEWFAAAEIVEE